MSWKERIKEFRLNLGLCDRLLFIILIGKERVWKCINFSK